MSAEKIRLPNVTLVCVDGRTDISSVQQSIKALKYSSKDIEFSSVKLFAAPQLVGKTDIEVCAINPLFRIEDYSNFVLKNLQLSIDTDYALIVQSDGFVVRPDLWRDEFLEYDYIGAPWPKEWGDRKYRVGNGGFSLRSKKLLYYSSMLSHGAESDIPEDNFICLRHRERLEQNGILFAPPEIASKFSLEWPVEENSHGNSFGFHGWNPTYLPHNLEYKKLLDNIQ